VRVAVDLVADGHDIVTGILEVRGAPGELSHAIPLTPLGNDQWAAVFIPEHVGWCEYTVVAWIDQFESWHHDLVAKADAGQEVTSELAEGALIVRQETAAALKDRRVTSAQAAWLNEQADVLEGGADPRERVQAAGSAELHTMMAAIADRGRASRSAPLRVWVDRERARVGAWYEMFPRSVGSTPGRGGTLRQAEQRIEAVAAMGFDVLYLPPIHPIGQSFRKGPNNALHAGSGDPGSPWAIGSEAGGHMAVDPGLGTIDDFDHFRRTAEDAGLEVALDLAFQCSPDHPWVREHPEWFRRRPDGTIKYAENPPKKYQDIYPLDFECAEWQALWQELTRVVLFWIDHGVKIFRVDNPHTKTFGFWEWLIAEVQAIHPDIVFLAEAFTRPLLMRHLAKAGFTQSYTYFTWRNTRDELTEYLTELTQTAMREYFRPNLFANTPDILHAYLQTGGRPAFQIRLILAATLGASYGIYSGFELCENRSMHGTEEYLDSEKYQYRQWDWDRPGHIIPLVTRVNAIRREQPALGWQHTLQFHATDNPQLLAYSKTTPDGRGRVLTIVNLDPFNVQQGWVQVPIGAMAIPATRPYLAHDLLADARFQWMGEWNYVRLDPQGFPAHILRLEL
jgi:starch synthase (maltosyl-transferring)